MGMTSRETVDDLRLIGRGVFAKIRVYSAKDRPQSCSNVMQAMPLIQRLSPWRDAPASAIRLQPIASAIATPVLQDNLVLSASLLDVGCCCSSAVDRSKTSAGAAGGVGPRKSTNACGRVSQWKGVREVG